MHTDKLKNIIVVGDRVLIKIKSASAKTRSGLFLPPGYTEKEEVQYGYIIKVGPGYPIPLPGEDQPEPWKKEGDEARYLPLQAKIGDLAIFLQKGSIELTIGGEKYFIVQHHSILLLERDYKLFD